MKAAVVHGPGDLRVEQVATPRPEPGDLLVQVEACGLCPSDIRLVRSGHSDLLALPAVPGHETVGVVVEAGSRDDASLVGRRVFVDGWGGFAEYRLETAAARQSQGGSFLLPADLAAEDAIFVEPLADCLFAVDHCAEVRTATAAVVAGCGQMGLQIVRLCVLRGLRVVASDPLPDRRAHALRLGAEVAVDPAEVDLTESTLALTGGRGAEAAFLACPASTALPGLLGSLGDGGTCVLFSSLPPGETPLDIGIVHRRRLRLVGSRWVLGARAPLWSLYRQATDLLARGLLEMSDLIEMRVPLELLPAAIDAVAETRVMKAVVYPGLTSS